MAKTETTRYDVAEHLRTPEEMAAYLEACLEEADGDAAFIAKALSDIARAQDMSQLARDIGLSESFYKYLSGNRTQSFDTILKVVRLKPHAGAINPKKELTFEDIITGTASYPSGPMDNIPTFTTHEYGDESIAYDYTNLDPRYGTMVYWKPVI